MDTPLDITFALGVLAGSLWAFGVILCVLGHWRPWLTAIAGSAAGLLFVTYFVIKLGWPLAVPLGLLLLLAAGWQLQSWLRYRQARQEELHQVITTAVEVQIPVAPAIRSYLRDRPHSGPGGWDIVLLAVCPPGYPLWHLRHTYDNKAARLAALLDEGVPLGAALGTVRGVASREARVAASVGGLTGRLDMCLRRADRDRLAGAWVEIVPRLLYPVLLVYFIVGITTFLMVFVAPRFERIFADFGMPLPPPTLWLITTWGDSRLYTLIAVSALVTTFWVTIVLVNSPTMRWYFPVFGRLFRWESQGLVLRMLGTLLDVGWSAPKALQLLADTPHFPAVVQRRLEAARLTVERGEPLAGALRGAGLLPKTMTPLVQTAERTNTVPWALGELGDLLAGRAVRVARRVSLGLAPVLVAAVGLLVGFVALAMFTPLIQILTRLSV